MQYQSTHTVMSSSPNVGENIRVAIYQPRYFPQLHYFNRMADSNMFVFLDDAQYTKSLVQGDKRYKSYQSDTVIKLPEGNFLLTVPVKHNGLVSINKTEIDYNQKWVEKHLIYLKVAYKGSPHFSTLFPLIKELLKKRYSNLAELNITTTLWAFSYLLGETLSIDEITKERLNHVLEQKKIKLTKIITCADLEVKRPEGLSRGTEWTTEICKALGATEYLHGGTARDSYMDIEYYKQNGITPVVQDWKCCEYSQQFSKRLGFISNLSILDLLFNVSTEEARTVIYGLQS